MIKGLYAIVDNAFSPKYSHVELAHLVLLGGCKLLQLRMKSTASLWSREVYDTAKKIMELKKKFEFTFIINDYIDVAGEVGADGVHVGPNDAPVAEARKRLGKDFIIGYSSSGGINLGLAAERNSADYIAFGAIFPTKAKGPNHPVQGLERLKELCRKASRPVVAIGGINKTNIDSVLACGVSSIAMIRGITEAPDIAAETKWYVEKCRQY
ncbi:MAG: thiamine phosphate synthase [Deltaproteobacteria bacterium]|nr:thiamine phosphate synthase [Deltaproteobacteria bacterium]